MDDQLTVRLPRELSQSLKDASERMQRKPSELVRMAVREFLEMRSDSKEAPVSRVRNLLGSVKSNVPDLALRHREYILKSLRRGR